MFSINDQSQYDKITLSGAILTVILALYFSSFYSYLLFHSLIEIVTVSIAFMLFIFSWNTRGYLVNNYLRILGTGYAFIGLIDLAHTLTYKGINVFEGYGANLPTQLWIAARYLQAVTLCAAPFFIKRKLSDRPVLAVYTTAVMALMGIVFSGNFPDCFIEGKGLTSFKIISEYLITAILLVSLYLLYRKRAFFTKNVYRLIISSIVFTVLSELSFTTYISVYGFTNMLGHYFKLGAFYFIYRAILVTGLREPFNLIFKELNETREKLRNARDNLEREISDRTAQLQQELTERKIAEITLSEERSLLRCLIDSVSDLIFIKDLNCVYRGCNKASEEFIGIPESEQIGKTDFDFFDREMAEKVLKADRQVIEEGKPLRVEERVTTREGETLLMETLKSPYYDPDGEALGIVGISRDITQRKKAEEEISTLNRELEQRVRERTAELEASNKELESFVYSISHDLRAPLRHIDGYMEMLKKNTGAALDEQDRQYMETISASAHKMGQLIDDLISFSRTGRQEMKLQDVELGTLVRKAIEELGPQIIGRNIRWNIGELPAVRCDESMLRVVIMNLFSNSLKFTRSRDEALIEAGCEYRAGEVAIFVRDNGAGFDQEYADNLFGVFQRLHRSDEFEGTGVGLALVQRIIHRHGGRVWARGEIDKGATFYFSLPKPGKNDHE